MIEWKDIPTGAFISVPNIGKCEVTGFADKSAFDDKRLPDDLVYLDIEYGGRIIIGFSALRAMGATLFKDPRRMSVWEWREYPDVKFKRTISGKRFSWNSSGYLLNAQGVATSTDKSLLESEGVEVMK